MTWRKTFEGAEPQRVNKWLAQAGVCSRREAEALIAEGKVRIDGAPVADVGRKILPGETLEIIGDAAQTPPPTFVLNKPPGVVSAQPEPGQIPAARLLTPNRRIGPGQAPGKSARLAPLGRLDLPSRGLLLLSEDGVLAKAVIGPASQLDKEYLVATDRAAPERALALLRHGLELDGRALKPAIVERLGDGRLRFVLREGRNRQIRRMCALVGLEVTDLARVRIGPLRLGDLPEGAWRLLRPEERALLIAHA